MAKMQQIRFRWGPAQTPAGELLDPLAGYEGLFLKVGTGRKRREGLGGGVRCFGGGKVGSCMEWEGVRGGVGRSLSGRGRERGGYSEIGPPMFFKRGCT